MFAMKMQQYREIFVKFGYAGILFFTIKGLLWLLLPVIFAWYLQ